MKQFIKALALATLVLPGVAAAQDFTLRMGHFIPPSSSYLTAIESVPDRIKKATGGRVEIQLFSNLVPGPNLPDAVRDGRLDIVAPLHPWVSGTAPTLALAELPGLFEGAEDYKVALDQFLNDEYVDVWRNQFNAVVLASGMFDRPVILSQKPLRTADDFKGIRIRVPSVVMSQLMESLGAQPVQLPFGEIAPAMERGVVDAVLTDAGTSRGMGFFDVAKYVNLWDIAVFSWPILINANTWASLPEDVQGQLRAEFQAIQADHFANYNAHNAQVIKDLEAKGMTVVTPSEEGLKQVFSPENLEPLYQRYLKLSADRGRPADDLLKAARAVSAK